MTKDLFLNNITIKKLLLIVLIPTFIAQDLSSLLLFRALYYKALYCTLLLPLLYTVIIYIIHEFLYENK